MYIPSHFQINEQEASYEVIEKNSFAALFSQHNGTPFATHLPLMLDKEKRYLYGHFARANPQWQDIENQVVLSVFQGPHCYISPSWYETDIAVPTWNYVTVHVYGKAEIIEDQHELLSYLNDLVSKYEQPNSSYQLDAVDSSFIQGMGKGIVGFKIIIDKIEGKAKLSQNHPAARQERIIRQLEQVNTEDTAKIASLMRNNLSK